MTNADVPDKNVGDTINRQAAIYLLEHEIELSNRALDFAELVGTEREKYSWGLGLLESIAEDIKELPSAEPERKKGKWLPIGNTGLAACKCCGYSTDRHPVYNFCPICGAEMVKGESDGRT